MSSDVSSLGSLKLAMMLGADLRSLAALRIGIAIILIQDLIQRSTDLEAHYSDFGLLPRVDAIAVGYSRWLASLHFLNGTWQVQALLFSLAGLIAVALLLGYKTRWVTILSWVLLCSLQTRNTYLNAGGDTFLRILLFWCIFLPLGARWSVDSRGVVSNRKDAAPFLSLGTVAYVLQFCFLYWFTAILKSGAEWRSEGSALYYALSLEYLATDVAKVLLEFPSVLKAMTFATLWIEILGPFLLVSPFFTERLRLVGISGLWGLHFGILVTLLIGNFPVVNMVSLLFFLPASFWEFLTVRWAKSRFSFKFSHVQTLCQSMLAYVRPLVEWSCDFGASGRFDSGKLDNSQRVSGMKLSPLKDFVLVGLLVYVLAWNLASVPSWGFKLSERVRSLGFLVSLDQGWSMFAPSPSKKDGWYVIPGRLKNGQTIDVFTGGKALNWKKPVSISATVKNHRWRKYMELLRYTPSLFPYYSAYLCRDWNRRHVTGEQLVELEIVFMLEVTLPNFDYSPVEKVELFKHVCASEK